MAKSNKPRKRKSSVVKSKVVKRAEKIMQDVANFRKEYANIHGEISKMNTYVRSTLIMLRSALSDPESESYKRIYGEKRFNFTEEIRNELDYLMFIFTQSKNHYINAMNDFQRNNYATLGTLAKQLEQAVKELGGRKATRAELELQVDHLSNEVDVNIISSMDLMESISGVVELAMSFEAELEKVGKSQGGDLLAEIRECYHKWNDTYSNEFRRATDAGENPEPFLANLELEQEKQASTYWETKSEEYQERAKREAELEEKKNDEVVEATEAESQVTSVNDEEIVDAEIIEEVKPDVDDEVTAMSETSGETSND